MIQYYRCEEVTRLGHVLNPSYEAIQIIYHEAISEYQEGILELRVEER